MSSTHFNKLTPAEAELLSILAEEASEVIKAVTKIERHGFESYNPDAPDEGTNREMLEKEIGDFDAVLGRMGRAKMIDLERVKVASGKKHQKLKKWTHHQPDSLLPYHE